MRLVADVSVVASWAFADEKLTSSRDLANKVELHGCRVPALFHYEIRNALLMNERRGRIHPEQSSIFLDSLSALSFETDLVHPHHEVLALARKHQLTVYDASYLELSLRTQSTLLTFDSKLAEAARAENISVAP